jgi:hypothetical protein
MISEVVRDVECSDKRSAGLRNKGMCRQYEVEDDECNEDGDI